MDFYIVMKRKGGLRTTKKRAKAGRMGPGHRIAKSECQSWFKDKYEGILLP